ncbi:MAG: hypothetical protein WBC04_02590 [Candidatus Acidiferrales bacterium]
MKRIELVFFDAGGGHRSAATSLKLVAEQQKRPWDMQLLNLQELLDELDFVRRYTGIRIQEVYNSMLRSGWTLGSAQIIPILQATIRLRHRGVVRLLERHWTETRPDMVISLVPHFNRSLCESFRNAFPGRPFVTLLTDLADYPPHFWMERQQQYFICGTERALAQAHGLGHNDAQVFLTSGMILHPRFYEPVRGNRREERVNLGIDPDLPTGLVLFGGYGSGAILEIAQQLDQSGLSLQLILICGRNEKLAAKLRKRRMRIPCFVEGFTTNVPYYMHLSDFFMGKPGPGAISEALVMRLPVIVECNAWTLPQERYNTAWIREKDVGLVLHNFREIQSAAAHMLEPSNLVRFRENTAALPNRAVFEIPDILEKILHLGNREDEQKLSRNNS